MNIFIYQTSYLNSNNVDEHYENEFNSMKKEGYQVYHIDLGDIKNQDLSFVKDCNVIYRGWMLTIEDYQKFENEINHFGGTMVTKTSDYKSAHYLPEWYSKIKYLTPTTHVFTKLSAALEFVKHNDGHKYFVKDFVKSLHGINSSIVSHHEELQEWIEQGQFFRGIVEGGLCLREIEEFKEDTEIRFFVFNGLIYSNKPDDEVPDIVLSVLKEIKLPFITIDIVLNEKDQWRVVEIGDGQVSDSSKWELSNFPCVFDTYRK